MYTVAPNYPRFHAGFRYAPEWGAAGVIVLWQLYRWYGHRRAAGKPAGDEGVRGLHEEYRRYRGRPLGGIGGRLVPPDSSYYRTDLHTLIIVNIMPLSYSLKAWGGFLKIAWVQVSSM